MEDVELTQKNLIKKIRGAFEGGVFENYIEYIRFPFYKNLELDSKIEFSFPFCVFTGQNGSGKSSTLHAIQGAPGGESPTKYWYSTPVDPINDVIDNPHCFIYGYYNAERTEILEVLKTRINLRENPDYWEPSRPLKKYGMTLMKGKRNPTIAKNVIYHDFRAELSAYDKYFYFGDLRKTITIQSKQDYIRRYSWRLKKIIENDNVEYFKGQPKNEKPKILGEEALTAVSKILGKEYIECKIIIHSWFRSVGTTIYFKTGNLNYSEAFAGRGEFAVVKIVNEVLNAPDFSLIVLDEPEVSLHPGAQKQLKLFLLEQTLKKKLQVVISSHSPYFIDGLPEQAVKLFYPTSTGKFAIKNQTHEIEAFNFIGHDSGEKLRICVEDKLAQMILTKTIETLGSEYALLFDVEFYPGGAGLLYKSAVKYSIENEKQKFILLDGDERKPKCNPGSITRDQAEDFNELKRLIKESTGADFNKLGFQIDSHGQSESTQKIDVSIRFLEFIWSNLEYFPGNGNPEALLWNSDYATTLLRGSNIQPPSFASDYKENFFHFCKLFFGDTSESSMLATHKLFINDFCQRKDCDYQSIVDTLKKFKESKLN